MSRNHLAIKRRFYKFEFETFCARKRAWPQQRYISDCLHPDSGGELWEVNFKSAIFESVFFIPIISPTAAAGRHGPVLLAFGVLIGLFLPVLAGIAKPFMGYAVFAFTLGAIIVSECGIQNRVNFSNDINGSKSGSC